VDIMAEEKDFILKIARSIRGSFTLFSHKIKIINKITETTRHAIIVEDVHPISPPLLSP
jgi:hypothetical protein